MVTLTNTNGFFGAAAGTALHYDFSQISWKDSGSSYDEASVDIGFAGGGVKVEGNYEVEVGLTGAAHLDLGSMTTTMELDGSTAVVDSDGSVLAGFDSSLIDITDFAVEVAGPDAAESYIELGLHAALNMNAKVTAFAWYDVLLDSGSTEGEIFNGNLIDVDQNVSLIPKTTLDVIGGLDGNILTVALGEYFEAKIDLPEFEYDEAEFVTVEGKPDQMVIHGESSPFASIEFGLASFLGLGPWGESVELGFVEAGIEAGLFDAKLAIEANLVQDITVDSDIGFSMTTTLNDDVITGTMGDAVTFDTPEGEGDFQVTVDYTLYETVESTMSLLINSFIDLKLIFGAAYVSIPAISEKWEFEISVAEERIDLGELLGLSIAFELTHDVSVYISDMGQETYTVHYENFVTEASGAVMKLTTHQVTGQGGKLDNEIIGNGLDNTLLGAAGKDTLRGNDGDDRLNGGAGDDLLDGGAGSDSVGYLTSRKGMTIDLLGGFAYGMGDDKLVSIENAHGSNHADWIGGDAGANVLRGANGNDTVQALGGDDTVDGGFGSDMLDGGEGIDTLSYASGTLGGVSLTLGTDAWASDGFFIDVITNFENLTGSSFADTLGGDDGANVLRGGAGDDLLSGNGGDDRLTGGAGADVMDGGAGIDTVVYASSTGRVNVYLNEGLGLNGDAAGDTYFNIENVFGSNFDDLFVGSASDNTMFGNAGSDYMYGDEGHDVLVGGEGDDNLKGEAGNDSLAGGAGDDYLDGGFGDDSFYFSTGTDIVVGDDGVDTIIFDMNFADANLEGLGADGRYYISNDAGDRVGFGYSTDVLAFLDLTIGTNVLWA